MHKTATYLIVMIIIGAIFGLGLYFYNDFQSINKKAEKTSDISGILGSEDIGGESTEREAVSGKDSVAVDDHTKEAGDTVNRQMPNLDRPIVVSPNVSQEIAARATEKIKEITLSLKEDPDLIDMWLDLGIFRKMIEDYAGALEAWEYASAIRPKDSRPFNNLANLYGYYVHDNKKAEANYLRAIENDPSDLFGYVSAFEFYLYVMKDESKARAIVEQGIKANPNHSKPLRDLLNTI